MWWLRTPVICCLELSNDEYQLIASPVFQCMDLATTEPRKYNISSLYFKVLAVLKWLIWTLRTYFRATSFTTNLLMVRD